MQKSSATAPLSTTADQLDSGTKPNVSKPAPLAYNIKQALGAVPLSRSCLYVEMAAGRLRSFKVGKRRLIAVADLDAWVAARRDAGTTAGAGAR